MTVAAHTSALPVTIADDVVDVQLSMADAIAFAQTARGLARQRRVPPGVGDLFNRVASQILSAARVKIAQQKAGR